MSKFTVHVCTVGCCRDNGGLEIFRAFSEEIERLNLQEQFTVREAECNGICKYKPTVVIETEKGEKFFYGNINPEVAKDLLKYHIQNNKDSEKVIASHLVKKE
ncbi:MAG: (2Fe-2S) ferredoxin domain-containing protein [Fervidobacterium gondwanense]